MKWVTNLFLMSAFMLTTASVSFAGHLGCLHRGGACAVNDCCGNANAAGNACCNPCNACADGAAAGAGCATRTVMRSEYVTETRQIPVTTYQQETRTRTRQVTKCVPRTETREETYTVNVPHKKTKTVTYNVQVCVPHTEEQTYKVQGSRQD